MFRDHEDSTFIAKAASVRARLCNNRCDMTQLAYKNLRGGFNREIEKVNEVCQ